MGAIETAKQSAILFVESGAEKQLNIGIHGYTSVLSVYIGIDRCISVYIGEYTARQRYFLVELGAEKHLTLGSASVFVPIYTDTWLCVSICTDIHRCIPEKHLTLGSASVFVPIYTET